MNERTLASREVYRGRVLTLRIDEVELDGGRRSTREIVEHPGAVAMVALDDQGRVLLVRQYRKPIERISLEIPAGTREPGESPEATARRELLEETGHRGDRWRLLSRFYSAPGFCTEHLEVYLVEGLQAATGKPDDDEHLELERVPLAQALAWVADGTICDAKSIIGLTLTERLRTQEHPGSAQ